MTEENRIKAQNMFAIAESYKRSALLLPTFNDIIKNAAQHQQVKMPNGDIVNFDSVHITCVVLYGLVVEIFLKALIVTEDADFGRLHNHEELFNALPTSLQSEIINSMPTNFQPDFQQLLEANKKTFIDWRYCYEKEALTCDVTFLKELSNVLSFKLQKLTVAENN